MAVAVARHDLLTVVTPAGHLDAADCAQLRTSLQAAARSGPALLVVDMEQVGVLVSSCLAVLLTARRSVRAGGGRVALINVQAAVLTDLHVCGLDKVFEVSALTSPPTDPQSLLDRRRDTGAQRVSPAG